nr:hypothetical protein [Ignavibacteriaceae bacterium]
GQFSGEKKSQTLLEFNGRRGINKPEVLSCNQFEEKTLLAKSENIIKKAAPFETASFNFGTGLIKQLIIYN